MATISELQTTLAKYQTARDKILDSGQSYSLDGFHYTRADLSSLEKHIERIEQSIAVLSHRGRLRYSIAVFSGGR